MSKTLGLALLLLVSACDRTAQERAEDASIWRAPDASTDASVDASVDRGGADRSAPPSGDGAVSDGEVAYYGQGIGADSLDNHQVADVDVDFRFRAATTAALTSFLWYDIYDAKCAPHSTVDAGTCPADCPMSGDVYACGTGGDMHICIQTDDGSTAHLATGTNLGCVDHPNASGPPFLPLETFPAPAPQLTKGTLYHLHWHNTDPQPTVNFTSVDTLYVNQATIPRQPTIADVDLAVFRGTTLRPADTAIFQLSYSDGTVQGQGYMEVWSSMPATISGSARVREQFTVTGADRTVTRVAVRVKRTSGTSALTVALGTGTGAVLEQGEVSVGAGTDETWASFTFTTPHVLASAQPYALVLSAPPDTVYQAYAVERGANYAFLPPTFFGDGYGQTSVDGGPWVGFAQPGGSSDSHIADVQFYFE